MTIPHDKAAPPECQPCIHLLLDESRAWGIMQRAMHWDFAVILALLAVVVPWRSTARVRELVQSEQLTSAQRIGLYVSTIAFQWGISAIILWRILAHRMNPAELGFAVPDPPRAIAAAVALSAVLIANQVLGVKRLASLPREKRGLIAEIAEKLLPRTRKEALIATALVASVAICEEFIYRGFIEGIFEQMFHSALAGAVISALFFSVAHLYQGRKGLLTTFAVGLIFSAARVWTRSLLPLVIIHFVVDFSAGIAASRMLLDDAGAARGNQP